MDLVEENKALTEQLKEKESQVATIKEDSYNSGWTAAYEDAEVQIGYICRLNFKKGWNKALLAASVDVESPLFNEHDPGPKTTVDEEATVPSIEGVDLSSQTVPAGVCPAQTTEGIPAEGDASVVADKGKQPTTSGQPVVAS